MARLSLGLLSVVFLAGFLLVNAGCSSPPKTSKKNGVVHVVKAGETVWRISRKYGVSVETVVKANHIRDVTEVRVGARLWIPLSKKQAARVRHSAPSASSSERQRAREQIQKNTGLRFQWPVTATLTSRFGSRKNGQHEGIDLGAKKGTEIRCSESGRVIYSGNGLGDYGNVIIVKHAGNYSTVYAHNRKNLVKKGSFVERGQIIAWVGNTGNASGPHLHFEIRRSRTPVDPLLYLP